MNIKPLSTKVFLKIEDTPNQTSSGIYISEDAKEKSHVGIVAEVGPGTKDDKGNMIEPTVKKGQKVLIGGSWTGDEVKIDNQEYKVVDFKDILAIIED